MVFIKWLCILIAGKLNEQKSNFFVFTFTLWNLSFLVMVLFITGRNEVVAKVIFIHRFVILFTGGSPVGRTPPPRRPPLARRNPPWQGDPPGKENPPGRETPPGQGEPSRQGEPPARETPWQGELPLARRTPRQGDPPAGRTPPPPYGQWAAGTHPTGMHSWLKMHNHYSSLSFCCDVQQLQLDV